VDPNPIQLHPDQKRRVGHRHIEGDHGRNREKMPSASQGERTRRTSPVTPLDVGLQPPEL
jgi:hypothetical protein